MKNNILIVLCAFFAVFAITLNAQNISNIKVIKKSAGSGGADSIYINNVWYKIPQDSVIITAPPSDNSAKLGGQLPAFYKDTIFYNGKWLHSNDTLYINIPSQQDSLFYGSKWLKNGDTLLVENPNAVEISTISTIQNFTNLQDVTNYVDSVEYNFFPVLEEIISIPVGVGACESAIAYTVNDTDYITVVNNSANLGRIRIYNAKTFQQVAIVEKHNIKNIVFYEKTNKLLAIGQDNKLNIFNYLGGDNLEVDFTPATISATSDIIKVSETNDFTTFALFGRESSNLWRCYRIIFDNSSGNIDNILVSDSLVVPVLLTQITATVTGDTIYGAVSSGTYYNRIFEAINVAGKIKMNLKTTTKSVFFDTNNAAYGNVFYNNKLYVNWTNSLTSYSTSDFSSSTEYLHGGYAVKESKMYVLSNFTGGEKLITMRNIQLSNIPCLLSIFDPNTLKEKHILSHAQSIVGIDLKNKYIFTSYQYINSFVTIYKYK